jgi:hypothetical protein
MASSSSSSRRTRAATPLLLALFAALTLLLPRVVSAAGTAVEDTLEAPAGLALYSLDDENNNDNDNLDVAAAAEQEEGSVPAWAAQAVGNVDKMLRDVASGFSTPELQEENNNNNHEEEEVQGASVPDVTADVTDVTAAAAAVEDEDWLQQQDALAEEAMYEAIIAEAAEEVESADAALIEVLEALEETYYGGEGGEQVPVVTTVTTASVTTTTTTAEGTSVYTSFSTTVEEEELAAGIDDDIIVFTIGDDDTVFSMMEDDAATDARLAMLAAGNGVSVGDDIYDELRLLQQQEEVDAAYAELLTENYLEEELGTRTRYNPWDGGVSGFDTDTGYFGGEGVQKYTDTDDDSRTLRGSEDLDDTIISASLIRSLLPTAWWDTDIPTAGNDINSPRRGLRPGSVTFIFTDDQWPTPLYSARWMLSVDLVGLSICALSLTIVIVVIFGLCEDEKEEKQEKEEEEFDEERGVSLSDLQERESLLRAPEPVTTAAKGTDTGVDLAAEKSKHGYSEEPPAWTNPCTTWKYR